MIEERAGIPNATHTYRWYTDVQLIAILVINGFFITLYQSNLQQASTIVATYYLQSVFVGIFHFIRLANLKNTNPESITVNGEPVRSPTKAKWITALFFAFHYGFFHFVYLFFLAPMLVNVPGRVDFLLVLFTLGALIIGGITETIGHVKADRERPPVAGLLFFLPYVRIVPMHLFIMLAFTQFEPSMFLYFLLMKTGAEIITHLITAPGKKRARVIV